MNPLDEYDRAIRRFMELEMVSNYFRVVAEVPRFAIVDRLLDADETELAESVRKLDQREFKPYFNSPLQPLVGQTVFNLFETENGVGFETRNVTYESELYGDCCSHTWLYQVKGVEHLLGRVVMGVMDVEPTWVNGEDGLGTQESEAVYAIGLVTITGTCVIVYRNSSNGYYGGSLNTAVPKDRSKIQIQQTFTEDWVRTAWEVTT